MKCQLNTSAITIINTGLLIVTAPSITVTNDTVTDDSTATLFCLSSINDIRFSFVYKWRGPVISEETDGILIKSSVVVYDAVQYMCTSTASYTVIRLYLIELLMA